MPLSRKQRMQLEKQINKWDEEREPSRIIETIEAIPEQDRDEDLDLALAEAYIDTVMRGEGQAGQKNAPLTAEDERLLKKAVGILRPMERGRMDDPSWNFCMMTAIGALSGDINEVKRYARRALGEDDLSEEEFDDIWEDFFSKEEESGEEGEPFSTEDTEALSRHFEKYFGSYQDIITVDVQQEEYPSFLHICVVLPNKEHSYYSLVTMGLSEYPMDIPEDLPKEHYERAELVVKLPADWKLTNKALENERWHWPLRIISSLARIAGREGGYFLPGDTFNNTEDKPFARGTDLSSVLLTECCGYGEGGDICRLPSGKIVRFYQLIPLYKEEEDFIIENDQDAFFDRCPEDITDIVDPKRRNVITGEVWQAKKHK